MVLREAVLMFRSLVFFIQLIGFFFSDMDISSLIFEMEKTDGNGMTVVCYDCVLDGFS